MMLFRFLGGLGIVGLVIGLGFVYLRCFLDFMNDEPELFQKRDKRRKSK